MEKVLGKVNVFFLTFFIILHHFQKSKRFLSKNREPSRFFLSLTKYTDVPAPQLDKRHHTA